MSIKNSDLQATQQILSVLEWSKTRVDEILDQLPGFFLVMDESGVILKGNAYLATEFGVAHERVLSKKFKSLFSTTGWALMMSYVERVLKGEKDLMEFELPVEVEGKESRPFIWKISPFFVPGRRKGHYVCLLGQDISGIRKAEKALSELFSTIPLGILVVNAESKIEPRYSAYVELLFGTDEIAGKNFIDLLFRASLREMKPDIRNAVETLPTIFNAKTVVFDVLSHQVPKQIKINTSGSQGEVTRTLGLFFQPVVQNDCVTKLLILVEDQTDRERALREEKLESMRLGEISRRVNEIQRCAPDVMEICFGELDPVIRQLSPAALKKDTKTLVNSLHNIKGNGRILGFDFLKVTSHELERFIKSILEEEELKKTDWDRVSSEIGLIENEWNELQGLYEALILRKRSTERGANAAGAAVMIQPEQVRLIFESLSKILAEEESLSRQIRSEQHSIALLGGSFVTLDSVRDSIGVRVQSTAETLHKKVRVQVECPQVWVAPLVRDAISECLLHIYNNAVSHGIELPEQRVSSGKSPEGLVQLNVRDAGLFLELEIFDDGLGVNVEKVKRGALRRGELSLDDLARMSPHDVMQLIFRRDLSTAEELSEISGQGVGLNVVKEKVESLGGTVYVENREQGGARFVMRIGKVLSEEMGRRSEPLSLVSSHFAQALTVADSGRVSVVSDVRNGLANQRGRGVWIGDMRRASSSVNTLTQAWLAGGSEGLQVSVDAEEAAISVVMERQNGSSASPQELPLSWVLKCSLPSAWMVLRQHGGQVEWTPNRLKCTFGLRLPNEQIPHIRVGVAPEVVEAVAETRQRIIESANDLGVVIEWTTAGGEVDLRLTTQGDETQPQLRKVTPKQSGQEVPRLILSLLVEKLGIRTQAALDRAPQPLGMVKRLH